MKYQPQIAPKIAPCYTHKGRNIALRGGRGSSKSTAVADMLIGRSFRKSFRALCTREIQNSIKDSVKKLLEDRIAYYGLSDCFYITKEGITNKQSKGEFIFCGLRDPNKIKSFEGISDCWIEEAQSITATSIKVLTPTIRAAGSQLIWTYNPTFNSDPVHVRFTGENVRPDDLIIEINYGDNPWFLETALVEDMGWDKVHDYNKYLHVWMGECVVSTESQIFNGCWQIGEVPGPPQDTVFYHGGDWGFANDPTAAIRCWIPKNDPRTLYIDKGIRSTGLEIENTPAFLRRIDTIKRGWQVIADSARPETISHCKNHGLNIRGARKGPGSIEDGIQFVRGFNVIISPDLHDVAEEFAMYSYKKDPKTDEIMPIPIDKYNHYIDSLRYALEPLQHGKTGVSSIIGLV